MVNSYPKLPPTNNPTDNFYAALSLDSNDKNNDITAVMSNASINKEDFDDRTTVTALTAWSSDDESEQSNNKKLDSPRIQKLSFLTIRSNQTRSRSAGALPQDPRVLPTRTVPTNYAPITKFVMLPMPNRIKKAPTVVL